MTHDIGFWILQFVVTIDITFHLGVDLCLELYMPFLAFWTQYNIRKNHPTMVCKLY